VLLAVMIFLYPARPWHFSAGAVTAGMGLLLMATGFYRARRDR
jgi:hypothetical protein